MSTHTPFAGVLVLCAFALCAVSCRDSSDPGRLGPQGPDLAITTGTHPAMDRFNGSLNESGTMMGKGFDPTNPHLGSAIIATFFWLGSTNIVTSVTDHLVDGTPVGNDYQLVDYVTAGGISMATYVATNVQNFPDPNPSMETILVVQATLSEPITDGGLILASYSGVEPDFEHALASHQAAAGAGSATTTTTPAPIATSAGALVYGVTLSNGVTGVSGPDGFTNLSTVSDASLKADAEYAVADGDSTAPAWTWFFNSPSAWLTTTFALNRAPGQNLVLDGTLNESGSTLEQGFIPTNPHNGDAIIATFFWNGSTNVITTVSDRLSDGTQVGNTYHLVEYATAGGISMATYAATNAQNFPDPNDGSGQVLVVAATLSAPVEDGGVMLSAYSGVKTSIDQALGEHRSAGDSGSSVTTADAGTIAVEAGALVYGVTMSNGVVGLERPAGLTNITTMSDASMKSDGEYAVAGPAGSADPQWTWYFNAPSTWVATVLSLKPR